MRITLLVSPGMVQEEEAAAAAVVVVVGVALLLGLRIPFETKEEPPIMSSVSLLNNDEGNNDKS